MYVTNETKQTQAFFLQAKQVLFHVEVGTSILNLIFVLVNETRLLNIYMYSNFINKSPLYTLYTWYGCDRFTLKIQISNFPWSIHIYIYIFQSHDCYIFSLVPVVGNMYNICMHSSCHSFSYCTFL